LAQGHFGSEPFGASARWSQPGSSPIQRKPPAGAGVEQSGPEAAR